MDEERKLMDYGMRLLAGRRYHTVEMRRKLRGRCHDNAIIENTIEKLTSYNYLNDGEYVRLYIEELLRSKPRGRRMIKNMLLRKGIPAAEADEGIKSTEMDEYALAVSAAEKKIKTLQNIPSVKQKEKLHRFLIARGFTNRAAAAALEAVL